jgi:hypothetical protein
MTPKLTQKCPYCSGPTAVTEIHCAPCGVSVQGKFETNEFAKLSGDELQFLRIFLQCEGRIKEMEAPLGLSYPTIRTRLGQLKEKVLGVPKSSSIKSTLADLESGNLDFDTALKAIKKIKGEKK